MPTIINKLSPKDNAALLKLHNYNFTSSQWKITNWNRFFNSTEKPIFYAIKEGPGFAGFVMGKQTRKNTSVVLLNTLLVTQAYRKNGYGKKLVTLFLQAAFRKPYIKKVLLHFREANKKNLLPFYTKLGFSNHCVHGSYKNGEAKHYLSMTRKRFKNL